jgi:tripartite-type tricarboxylate transporter receptor subunit TctC
MIAHSLQTHTKHNPRQRSGLYVRRIMRTLLASLLSFAVLGATSISTVYAADDYPNRPIRLAVGFAPGGATDVVARLLIPALSQELGQPVYVENIAGASGFLAWRNIAAAPADGYSLLMAENAIAIRPGFKDMTPTFDPITQLEPVAAVAHSPLALVIAEKVPANSMAELIALSRKTEKKLDYASAGQGSVAQLVWEVVKDGAKIEAIDVPYRGGGPAMAAIISNQVDIVMASTQVAQPQVESKRLKALAVTGKTRSPTLPTVPTLA